MNGSPSRMNAVASNLVDAIAGSSASRRDLERRIAEMGTGILAGVRAGEISFDQARHDLFNMDNLLALRRRRVGEPLKKFFEWAMELEDVAELAPEGLDESYGRLEELASRVMSSANGTRRGSAVPAAGGGAAGQRRGSQEVKIRVGSTELSLAQLAKILNNREAVSRAVLESVARTSRRDKGARRNRG